VVLALAAGCSLDPTDSVASRFDVQWRLLAAGQEPSCEAVGAGEIEVVSELVGAIGAADGGAGPTTGADAGPVERLDRLACAAGRGRTRPLEPGRYRVFVRALSETGAILGASGPVNAEVGARQTLELDRFDIDVGDGSAPGALPAGLPAPTF